MRLINTRTLKFHEYEEATVPYAILSHTWETEELTYQMMCNKTAEVLSLKGYEKVKSFCRIARERNYDYAWVDTCCIDKTNPTELSEAINSMFRWYAGANFCIALLADIDAADWDGHSPQSGRQYSRLALLQRSRWFERGWTLQELIAPSDVCFYSSNWQFLFRRTDRNIAAMIAKITGVDPTVLEGSRSPESFCVAVRMSWAAHRRTTREEDLAYCLLGLFEINMPLIYGEGKRAFQRLQEEIIRTSSDQTVFGWGAIADTKTDVRRVIGSSISTPVLAPTPACFSNIKRFLVEPDTLPERGPGFLRVPRPFSVTNLGIRIDVPIIVANRGRRTFLVLDPPSHCDDIHSMCIEVIDHGYGDLSTCHRCQSENKRLSELKNGRFKAQETFISTENPQTRTALSDSSHLTDKIQWWTTNEIADAAFQARALSGLRQQHKSFTTMLLLTLVNVIIPTQISSPDEKSDLKHLPIYIGMFLIDSLPSLEKITHHAWSRMLSRLCSWTTSSVETSRAFQAHQRLYVVDRAWLLIRKQVWTLQYLMLGIMIETHMSIKFESDNFDLSLLKTDLFGIVAISLCMEMIVSTRAYRPIWYCADVLFSRNQGRSPAPDLLMNSSEYGSRLLTFCTRAALMVALVRLTYLLGTFDWMFSGTQAIMYLSLFVLIRRRLVTAQA